MDTLIWIILVPIALIIILKFYNVLIRDFSPNKERVKETYQSDINLEHIGDAWLTLVAKTVWFLAKIGIAAVIVIVTFQISVAISILSIVVIILYFTKITQNVHVIMVCTVYVLYVNLFAPGSAASHRSTPCFLLLGRWSGA